MPNRLFVMLVYLLQTVMRQAIEIDRLRDEIASLSDKEVGHAN